MNEWRTSITAEDYFLHQQKRQAIDGRRPLIRKASDLVGPGIAEHTVRITDFSDPLAMVNGFFSSEPGALDAPNNSDRFLGRTFSDNEMGGWQQFRSLDTGFVYERQFIRNPNDLTTAYWGTWTTLSGLGTWTSLSIAAGYKHHSFGPEPSVRLSGDDLVYIRGTVSPSSGSFAANTQVVVASASLAFRPASAAFWVGGAGAAGGHAYARVEIAPGGDIRVTPQTAHGWIDISGFYWLS